MSNKTKKRNSKKRKRCHSNIACDDNEIDPKQSNDNEPLRKKRRITYNDNNHNIHNDDNFEVMLKPKPKGSLKEISNRLNACNKNMTSDQRPNINNNDKKQSNKDIIFGTESERIDTCSQDDVVILCKTEEIETESEEEEEEEDKESDIDIINDGVWCVLIASNKGYKTIQIKKDEFKIGRQYTNDLILDGNAGFYESTISNVHAKITKKEKLLIDHSRNGTFVNDKKIKKRSVKLKNGNLLSFGKQNQISSLFYFDVRGYETNIIDFDESFDVLLERDKINRNILILDINGNILYFDEKKYNKQYVTNIIYDAMMDINNSKDIASIICSYYGTNVFHAILYHFAKFRPPIATKPILMKQNCSFIP